MSKLDEKHIFYLAGKCIEKYDIGENKIDFIRQNENITLMVKDISSGAKYLMRIHEPINLNYYGIQHTYEGLECEKVFLQELNKGSDLILQKPVLNRRGEFVSVINDPYRNMTILCTLLTWIEGDKFAWDDENSEKLAFEYGIVLAKLHEFASSWEIPSPFIRPVYDAGKYASMVSRLDYGVEAGIYKEEELNKIKHCMKYIREIYDSARSIRGKWGIIHADTHTGNIIIHNGDKVVPIDFSFSGYGYYALDIGITLSSLKPHLREQFFIGYKTLRNIDETDMRLIYASYLLGIFGAFAFTINNLEDNDWLKRRLPEVANKECQMFVRKEDFIF